MVSWVTTRLPDATNVCMLLHVGTWKLKQTNKHHYSTAISSILALLFNYLPSLRTKPFASFVAACNFIKIAKIKYYSYNKVSMTSTELTNSETPQSSKKASIFHDTAVSSESYKCNLKWSVVSQTPGVRLNSRLQCVYWLSWESWGKIKSVIF